MCHNKDPRRSHAGGGSADVRHGGGICPLSFVTQPAPGWSAVTGTLRPGSTLGWPMRFAALPQVLPSDPRGGERTRGPPGWRGKMGREPGAELEDAHRPGASRAPARRARRAGVFIQSALVGPRGRTGRSLRRLGRDLHGPVGRQHSNLPPIRCQGTGDPPPRRRRSPYRERNHVLPARAHTPRNRRQRTRVRSPARRRPSSSPLAQLAVGHSAPSLRLAT